MATQQTAFDLAGPASRELYRELTVRIASIGKFTEEVKKTSIHLVRKTAFVGVAPRKEYLLLTIKRDKPLKSKRVLKSEQTSRSRWHVEVKVTAAGDIDAELLGWVREAYELSA